MSQEEDNQENNSIDIDSAHNSQAPKKFKRTLSFTTAATPVKESCCTSEAGCSHENDRDEETVMNANSAHKANYVVHGMDCSACAVTIEKAVRQMNEISNVQVNYSSGKMKVSAEDAAAFDKLPAVVGKLGYTLERIERNVNTRTYAIQGMDCGSCVLTIENHLKAVSGVKQVNVHFATGKMTVEHDNSIEEIIKEVSKAGFQASLASKGRSRETKKIKSGLNTVILSGVLLLSGFVGSYTDSPSLFINILYALSILIGGYKSARIAFYAVKSRSLDMNVLMTTAVVGAAIIGEWFEGATVVWLFALGNMLQTRSIEKTRDSIRSLIDLAPPEAYVKIGKELVRKPVENISIHEVIVVKPGDKIPLDGKVVQGESSVNQAPITGESIPVDKHIGDTVYAGTINEHGSLEIAVTKLVEDTAIARIIHLVEEAQDQKAPTEAFVDRFARIYTPIVFILAIGVMALPPLLGMGTWGDRFYKGLELLVIACPCALVISTPVAIVSAIGNAAKNGILIKGGAFLEVAGKVSAVAFDKTGTLTEGKPRLSDVIIKEASQEELLSVALTLEEYSTHPIAKAIVDHVKEMKIAPAAGESFRNLTGKGVSATIGGKEYYAGNLKLFLELRTPLRDLEEEVEQLQQQGNTIVIVGTIDRILGVLAVADSIRESSVRAIKGLQYSGVHQMVMLTGDNEGTARKVAGESGVTRYFAQLMPEDKVSAIKQLQSEGYQVAMVGDGINDAPALATANLGIAMGGAGTDTAMETADIILMADNLEKLPHTIHLSRKAIRIIKQNIWFSLIIKAAALILIFPDLLTLWMAVISDTGAALIVILNSMRLLRLKSKY
ncbi:heavy metal translocating P-type ATPase [Paenibacillus radicis (ex Gao et al. 2016)]|uniref:Cd(2+)-exporting ATPase n=1 Tax=Paenibacillus radicis (ex Gao et al. 2016) TaxID=1737354 RepID=A0A917H852_9BACL|nr:heavy metal translocating P-type ATPase [Paenibacillus radicis (ex Gao et al. 2016)]GGG70567.1 copper-translocating P-type ATPase [Paenibacillus radicis (ex Gao et al. 2016)]